MTPTLIYCYDAYCGWCYGFSPVIRRIAEKFRDRLPVEVLSGGMILREKPLAIAQSAGYIGQAYKRVEALTGIRFGQDYLWHIFNPDKSDWFLHSEKPAIALCIFKEWDPDHQVDFAADLQVAHHFEGRDLMDDEAYRHLLEKYQIPAGAFYQKMHDAVYRDKAYYEFSLVKQLKVTGFPALLLQEHETRFYLLSSGFTDYETLEERINRVLDEIPHEA